MTTNTNDDIMNEPLTWRGPDNTCFGCSSGSDRGLRLEFWQVAEHAVECRYTPEPDLAGAPGVVHGGVQAIILDEVLGYTCHTVQQEWNFVTAEMNLRYRAAVKTGEPLIARGHLVQTQGRSLHLEATIRSLDGDLLTEATARWVSLGAVDG
jgi:acyl-coenzyme A thioesterase PaaI-like protein